MISTYVLDEKGNIVYCSEKDCKEPATGYINRYINCASSTPTKLEPVCHNHQYIFLSNKVKY